MYLQIIVMLNWNIQPFKNVTHPKYLYMMKPTMHRQMSAYFLLCTFLILKTTIDRVWDPLPEKQAQVALSFQ